MDYTHQLLLLFSSNALSLLRRPVPCVSLHLPCEPQTAALQRRAAPLSQAPTALLFTLICFQPLNSFAQQAALGAEQFQETIHRYCVQCHDGATAEAGLDLNLLASKLSGPTMAAIARSRDAWERVAHKLRVQQMPPIGEPRPTPQEHAATLEWLIERLDQIAARDRRPGRTESMRRLTRYEYNNAIRDLLRIEVDASRWLPVENASHGFDNITVSDLSPTLLNRYVIAAQHVSRVALGGAALSPEGQTFRLPGDLTQERHMPGLPLGTRGGGLFRYSFPRDGEYQVTVRLARDRNEHVEGLRTVHQLELLLDRRQLNRIPVKPPKDGNHSLVDAHLKHRFQATAGTHDLGVTFVKHSAPVLSTLRQPYDARYNYHRHPRTMPAVYQVTITGPYGESKRGDTVARRSLLEGAPPKDASPAEQRAAAEKILSRVARRAYRRPVNAQDLNQPLRFFDEGRAQSAAGDFEKGMELALTAILVNPSFLFRIESDAGDQPEAKGLRDLTPLEVASRLSFFLWSSIPDDQLSKAAEDGSLLERKTLRREVGRMLADRRSHALVESFASQWLYLKNLDNLTPDLRLFPDFDDNLRQAFRRETELFVESVIREDRSILDLIGADYTYLNERLARHYRIPSIYGLPNFAESRRHSLPRGRDAAGCCGTGSVLTVTSYATRNLPGASRRLDSKEPARRRSSTATAWRACAGGTVSDRQALDGARTTRRASGGSGLRIVPQPHGPTRLRTRTL